MGKIQKSTFFVIRLLITSSLCFAMFIPAAWADEQPAPEVVQSEEASSSLDNESVESKSASAAAKKKATKTVRYPKTRWGKILSKYHSSKKVDRLIFVKYKGKRKARLVVYKKKKAGSDAKWKKTFSCGAITGQNGINKKREGDRKTPTGTFDITMGFGIKNNPGTKIKYKKLNRYLYWSGERATYNQLVDSRKLGHAPYGEHLISYNPHYNYALAIGYNPKNIYKKGSAIFLHVRGSSSYTAGCVGVSQKDMIKILKSTTKKTKICIYKK